MEIIEKWVVVGYDNNERVGRRVDSHLSLRPANSSPPPKHYRPVVPPQATDQQSAKASDRSNQ
jgi:hypothetical protein